MMPYILALGVAVLLSFALFFVGRKAGINTRRNIYEELDRCEELYKKGSSAKKECVIRMDTQLGKSLRYFGVKGQTTGERLKNARDLFDRGTYDGIWFAHKLRNRIVHEDQEIHDSDIDRAVKYFKIAVRRLLK